MVLTLYKLDASPPARAVHMVVELLEIPNVEFKDVNLLEREHLDEEFIKLNPQHTIPVLIDDDFGIWDSHAIATYLIGKYASDDSLYPKDLQKRAIVDQRLHFDSGILFPAIRGTFEPVFFGPEKTFKPENLAKIPKAYDFTEKFLTKEWLAGDQLTVADICCVATISSMDLVIPIDADLYPKLSTWLDRLRKLDFYKKINEPGLQSLKALIKSKVAT